MTPNDAFPALTVFMGTRDRNIEEAGYLPSAVGSTCDPCVAGNAFFRVGCG